MSALDLFVAIAVVAAVAFSLMSSPADLSAPARAPSPVRRLRPACQRWVSWRSLTGSLLRGDLLFVQRLGPRTLGLDCLLRASHADVESASPVQVRARCSVTWWAAERFMELVETWAEGAEPVYVELAPYAGSLRARISHHESCLILDVLATEEVTAAVSGTAA